MRAQMTRFPAVLLLAAAAAGCASAPSDAGFGSVRDAVARRTGDTVVWTQSADDDKAVQDRVRALLQEVVTGDRAVEMALMNNHGLQATLAELGIARADLLEAGLLRNPVFGGELRFPASPVKPFEFSIAQSFLDLIQLPLRKRVARSSFEQVKLQVGSAVLGLVAETRSAFYTLQAAEQTLDLRRSVADAAGSAAELARRQHVAGNITDLDLENQQALLEQAKLDQARSEAEALQDRERLDRLMGTWGPDTAWRIAPSLPDPPAVEVALAGLESLAVEQRLDVAAARAEVEVAAKARPLARLGRLGDVDLGVHHERETTGEKTTGPAALVSLPVFDRGQASVARALAQLRRGQERLAALAAQARSEVRAAHARLTAARSQVEYYRDVLLPRRRRIVAQTQLEYGAMLTGVFQLLQAKQNEVSAGREAIEACRDYWVARTELERAVGGRLVLGGGSK